MIRHRGRLAPGKSQCARARALRCGARQGWVRKVTTLCRHKRASRGWLRSWPQRARAKKNTGDGQEPPRCLRATIHACRLPRITDRMAILSCQNRWRRRKRDGAASGRKENNERRPGREPTDARQKEQGCPCSKRLRVLISPVETTRSYPFWTITHVVFRNFGFSNQK